jgi:hypothetical protein
MGGTSFRSIPSFHRSPSTNHPFDALNACSGQALHLPYRRQLLLQGEHRGKDIAMLFGSGEHFI